MNLLSDRDRVETTYPASGRDSRKAYQRKGHNNVIELKLFVVLYYYYYYYCYHRYYSSPSILVNYFSQCNVNSVRRINKSYCSLVVVAV